MTIDGILAEATASLESAGIGTARLDALVLLQDELKKDKAWILTHSDHPFHSKSLEKLHQKIERRISHEPLSYIRKKTEFFGREFIVDKRVLEPRPESETMIELTKDIFSRPHRFTTQRLPHAPHIADIGTGSGALAITAALEIPRVRVSATDIDKDCLKVAERNARKHKIDLSLHHGDLLRPLFTTHHPLTTILANLPYVPARYEVNHAARHEPALAIFGGGDGLELYRRMFTQLAERTEKPLFVLTESLPFQHQNLADIASIAGYKHKTTQDFIQVFVY